MHRVLTVGSCSSFQLDGFRPGRFHLDGALAAPPAVPIGPAKPRPRKKPVRDGLAREGTIRITGPPRLSSGPPELPGLTAASNWMRPRKVLPSFTSTDRSRPEMTPDVSESM